MPSSSCNIHSLNCMAGVRSSSFAHMTAATATASHLPYVGDVDCGRGAWKRQATRRGKVENEKQVGTSVIPMATYAAC